MPLCLTLSIQERTDVVLQNMDRRCTHPYHNGSSIVRGAFWEPPTTVVMTVICGGSLHIRFTLKLTHQPASTYHALGLSVIGDAPGGQLSPF